MNQENSNSDKITIKIRHSDEYYHEITIDWSNESFDYRKQLFHQLSAYTGIPIKQQMSLFVRNEQPRLGVELVNTECADWNTRLVTKEHAMSVFQDGDCFLLETLMYKNGAPNISCVYRLVHRDVATEFGCNLDYCHYLCRRSFSRRISEIIKAYQSQHILDPMAHGQTEEERQRSKEAVYDDHYREIMSIVHAHPAPYNCIIRDLAFSISKQDVEVKFQIYIASRRDPNKYEALKWLEYNKY
ncbi:uncharacterized protein LOC107368048 isoform X1 [Tetranychus urticae]|uniref:uncharacterized protein LOC107368048 isoform X1 n=1 Tax=Tetranychus urticae TaxID=32264 RepID=UPI00077BC235|nr:uncharacterized protein LOC107368048 isoform X1 [Tetranychus urticae]